MEMNGFIYHSMFEIDDTMESGSSLFTWDSNDPFSLATNERFYPHTVMTLNTCVLMETSYIVRLMPFKLPQSPCALNFTRRYLPPYTKATGTDTQDRWCKFDALSIDNQSVIDVPIIPEYNGIAIRAKTFSGLDVGTESVKPPNVRLEVSLRNKFVHTPMQPSSFKVLVFVKFMNTSMSGYSLDYTSQNRFIKP
jgi:hypothetical protein